MDTDPVTVARFSTVIEAESARAALEAEGIPSFLADAHLVTADPFAGLALGQIRLQVPPERAAEAARIVEAHEEAMREAREAREIDPEGTEDACVACGAAFPEYLDRCPACGLSYS